MAYYNRGRFSGNNSSSSSSSSSNGGGGNGDVRHARTVGALRAANDEQRAWTVGALRAANDEQRAWTVGALRAANDEQHGRTVGALRAAVDDAVDRINVRKAWFEALCLFLALIGGTAFGVYAAKVLFAIEKVDTMGNTRMVPAPDLYVLYVILGVMMAVLIYAALHFLPFGMKRRR